MWHVRAHSREQACTACDWRLTYTARPLAAHLGLLPSLRAPRGVDCRESRGVSG